MCDSITTSNQISAEQLEKVMKHKEKVVLALQKCNRYRVMFGVCDLSVIEVLDTITDFCLKSLKEISTVNELLRANQFENWYGVNFANLSKWEEYLLRLDAREAQMWSSESENDEQNANVENDAGEFNYERDVQEPIQHMEINNYDDESDIDASDWSSDEDNNEGDNEEEDEEEEDEGEEGEEEEEEDDFDDDEDYEVHNFDDNEEENYDGEEEGNDTEEEDYYDDDTTDCSVYYENRNDGYGSIDNELFLHDSLSDSDDSDEEIDVVGL